MKKGLIVSLVVVLAAVFAGIAAVSANGGAPRVATLTGAAEAPGPGDPDGRGSVSVWLNPGQGTVCWRISYEDLDTVVAAHIHVAPVGQPGPVVVPLSPVPGGCTSADPALIRAIIHNPEAYYVNVHTTVYPAGAIRGQLNNSGQGR